MYLNDLILNILYLRISIPLNKIIAYVNMKVLNFLYLFVCICNATKIISITSGGLKGFYMFGVCKYIKENYDLKNAKFYGASAGAWNSLYLSLKETNENFYNYVCSMNVDNLKNLYNIEENIKSSILNKYSNKDFKLSKLNLCVGVLKKCSIKKKIFSEFDNIEDAIDCCMASSHIPYITNGSPLYKYKKYNCIDGGFFPLPHPTNETPTIIIEPNMWKNKEVDLYADIKNLNIRKLVEIGYKDACKNKYELDFLLGYF